jgi:hypothetical protein
MARQPRSRNVRTGWCPTESAKLEDSEKTTVAGTAVPPIRGRLARSRSRQSGTRFPKRPDPAEKRSPRAIVARLNDCPPLGSWPERPINRRFCDTLPLLHVRICRFVAREIVSPDWTASTPRLSYGIRRRIYSRLLLCHNSLLLRGAFRFVRGSVGHACREPADSMNRRQICIMMLATASIEKYVVTKEQRS